MTVEAVLASACLPTLHHAVTIDGQAYWDGGFSRQSRSGDARAREPGRRHADRQAQPARDATACRPARARSPPASTSITFNQPMLRDVEVIETVRAHYSRWSRASSRRCAPGAPSLPPDRGRPLHRRAGAGEQGQARPRAADLPARRRPQRDREVAGALPPQHRRRSTVDLAKHFLARARRLRVAAAADTPRRRRPRLEASAACSA